MSNRSDLAYKIRFNNQAPSGTYTIPSDVKVVEMSIFPNGAHNSATDFLNVRFNGDTGSNYFIRGKTWYQTSGYSYSSSTATSINVWKCFDTTSPAVDQTVTRMILYPRPSSAYNYFIMEYMCGANTAEMINTYFGRWNNTSSSITSMTFLSAGGASLSCDIEIKFIR